MKVGQLFSMIEFDGLPEEQRDELEAKLATLRDDVPPVPFSRLEKLMREELGAPLGSVFADFDERAFAAASIGQVHRATTLDGDEVVVKVQYPGVAEAVDSDLRSATLLLPLIKRLAPGLDAKPLLAELRERIGEELDYELEAQHQRRVERLLPRPSVHHRAAGADRPLAPAACSSRSSSRASASRRSARSTRRSATATARSSSGSSSACSTATGSRSATRIPATTCCAPTAGSRSSTTASCATSAPRASTPSGRSRSPCATRIPPRSKAALVAGGYVRRRADGLDAELALTMIARGDPLVRRAGRAPALARAPRTPARERGAEDAERQAAFREQAGRFTLPPETILIRRMHALVAVVLSRLRASADWGAIAAEYLHGEPPATALGRAEAEYLARP